MKNFAWLVCVWVFSLGLLILLPVTRRRPAFQPAREKQYRFDEKGSCR